LILLNFNLNDICSDQKTTPWLVPYAQLSEDMKEFDRDPVRKIPVLLARIDLKVVRMKETTP
jgi:hypothetical protein